MLFVKVVKPRLYTLGLPVFPSQTLFDIEARRQGEILAVQRGSDRRVAVVRWEDNNTERLEIHN